MSRWLCERHNEKLGMEKFNYRIEKVEGWAGGWGL